MRRGIVFLGWSGNQSLAIEVKKQLQQYGYLGVIGGDYEENIAGMKSTKRTVNETVTYQMNRCNQAILLFENKRNPNGTGNAISGNLIYEMGYLSSKFSDKESIPKLHLFKINMDESEKAMLPTDLHGVWGTKLVRSEGMTDEQLATEVLEEFLRRQKLIMSENKLQLINSVHQIDTELRTHFMNPKYSDYELALNLVFYTQAKYIYQDISSAIEQCNRFKELLGDDRMTSYDLINAIDASLISLDLFRQVVVSSDARINMPGRVFRSFLERYRRAAYNILHGVHDYACNDEFSFADKRFTVQEVQEDEFRAWSVIQMQEHVCFLHLIYLDKEGMSAERRAELCRTALRYSDSVVHNCELFQGDEKNGDYSLLFLSYIYRNMCQFHSILGEEEEAKECDKKSFESRRRLYNKITTLPHINSLFKNYVALEYFVQLADNVQNMQDRDMIADSIAEMREYIASFEKEEISRTLVFSRFKKMYLSLAEKYGDDD